MKRVYRFFALILTFVFIASITIGCSASRNPQKMSPGRAFTSFMENMRQGNYSEAAQFVSLRTAAENQAELPTFLAWVAKEQDLDKITGFEVLDEKMDGSKAVVKVRLTANISGKEHSNEAEFPMFKEDGIWKLYLDSYGYPRE